MNNLQEFTYTDELQTNDLSLRKFVQDWSWHGFCDVNPAEKFLVLTCVCPCLRVQVVCFVFCFSFFREISFDQQQGMQFYFVEGWHKHGQCEV